MGQDEIPVGPHPGGGALVGLWSSGRFCVEQTAQGTAPPEKHRGNGPWWAVVVGFPVMGPPQPDPCRLAASIEVRHPLYDRAPRSTSGGILYATHVNLPPYGDRLKSGGIIP